MIRFGRVMVLLADSKGAEVAFKHLLRVRLAARCTKMTPVVAVFQRSYGQHK